MKKLKLVLILLIVMSLSLFVAGCQQGEVTSSSSSTNENSASSTNNNLSVVSSSEVDSSVDLPSTVTLDGLTFTLLDDNTYEVSSFDNSTSVVSIPDDIDGIEVTSITERAFEGLTNLTEITIPDSVTSIGDDAFNECSSLTKVNYTGTIDDWVQIEFGGAFANPICYAKKLYIDDILVTEANITTATKISDNAFYNCMSLTNITIGSSVNSIDECAFFYCFSLSSVTIGNNVTHIGNYAFDGCYSLSSVTIGSGVTSIGEQSFSGCITLKSVTIPDSVKSIGERAFYYCLDLASVTIGSGVTSIGKQAFYDCDNLVSATFANTSGWEYFSSSTATSGTSISQEDLSNVSTAAMYLNNYYFLYYWTRS